VRSIIGFETSGAVKIATHIYGLAAGVRTKAINRALTPVRCPQAGTVLGSTPIGPADTCGRLACNEALVFGRESGMDASVNLSTQERLDLDGGGIAANPFVMR